MKKEVGHIDAVPSKRLFLSIIADYDLNRSICELIDNVLDVGVKSERCDPIKIEINLEKNQQTIYVTDNASGIKKSDLRFIVGPGQTSNVPTEETIGIFGVGTKRAVVALAQDVKITTRYGKNKTYLVEFDDSWLESEDWELPVYEVDNLPEGTTLIELQKLRIRITDEAISHLKKHLQSTYARFLRNNRVIIKLGSDQLKPVGFENWAYPPSYSPRKYVGNLTTEDGGTVRVEVLAGLTTESSPAGGEYGVYFYCNDRLIARGLKNYNVGFTKGLAGQPHPSISLTRVIVSLNGEAQSMPWNSSKSGINPNHSVFVALRSWLVQVVKDYASLSRRFEGDWSEKVFKYPSGKIVKVNIVSFPEAKKSYLPPLPKSKPRYGDLVKQANRKIAKKKPWTKGLYEGIIAVDLIFKQKLEQKNRICLIILDSTLEIAFKEFLVNDSDRTYNDTKLLNLFNNRSFVHNEVKKYVKLSSNLWKKIEHYYRLRCKLIHERATVGIDDDQVEDFRDVVQKVLKKLFKLRFDKEQT
ncbi:ATP-binding protein [candidate division WOR-3 bacterium]|nr:ATP-binding protein [candidate division WOR-3 bacterium]